MALSSTSAKREERRITAASGPPADSRLPGARTACAAGVPIRSRRIGLWILSFGGAKVTQGNGGLVAGIANCRYPNHTTHRIYRFSSWPQGCPFSNLRGTR